MLHLVCLCHLLNADLYLFVPAAERGGVWLCVRRDASHDLNRLIVRHWPRLIVRGAQLQRDEPALRAEVC